MAAASTANAILIDYGTAEAISFRNCIAGITGCDDVSAPVQFLYGGYPGADLSAQSLTLAGYGTASGSVALSGTVGAPILRASATSEMGTRQNTNSFALQQYTYTGTTPTTRTFEAELTYSQTLTGTYPFEIGNGVNAAIDIFTLPAPTVEVGDTPASNYAALSNPSAFPGYVDVTSKQYMNANTTSAGDARFGVTVTLNPGDPIWVWVLLQTPAVNGGSVDAAHTLITAWDDPTNLVPAIVAVPEPGTLYLLAAGLAVIAIAPRRLRQRSSRRC